MKFKSLSIRFLYVLIDIGVIATAIYLACCLRPRSLDFTVNIHNLFFDNVNPMQLIFLIWMLATVAVAQLNGLYKTQRGLLLTEEASEIFRTVLFSTVTAVLAIFAFKVHAFSRTILLLGAVLIFVFMVLWRMIKRAGVEYAVSRGYNNFNIVIVGAGRVGETLAKEIQKNRALGLRIIGFLDDFKTEPVMGIPVIGKIDDFSRIAQREFINKLFITIHHDSQMFFNLLEEANELSVAVRVVPQGFDLISGDFTKFYVGYIPIWEYSPVIPFRKQVDKRAFDILASGLGLIFLFPLFLICALWIKFDSRGPVFYMSERYGRNGWRFKMLKFRTMYTGADAMQAQLIDQNEVDGPIFKMKNDPRVTRAGRILRKYSLDEIPQLINVFLGTMSLVGPRPFPVDQIEKDDLKQLRRLKVRPGITGLWQIRGRSDVSFAKLLRWDLWYINNWSFGLDLKILLNTIPVVVKGRGAY